MSLISLQIKLLQFLHVDVAQNKHDSSTDMSEDSPQVRYLTQVTGRAGTKQVPGEEGSR